MMRPRSIQIGSVPGTSTIRTTWPAASRTVRYMWVPSDRMDTMRVRLNDQSGSRSLSAVGDIPSLVSRRVTPVRGITPNRSSWEVGSVPSTVQA